MAAGEGEGLDLEVERLLSYAEDLLGILSVSTDHEGNARLVTRARMLQSACRSYSDNLELQIKEYQEKIDSCKEKIDKAKVETSADELKTLQTKIEELLQEEKQLRQDLRVLRDEIDDLNRQRVSIKERKDAVKKKTEGMQKIGDMLTMCISVAKIVPKLDGQDKVSGNIVDENMKKILDRFEFENTRAPVEICNELWKLSKRI